MGARKAVALMASIVVAIGLADLPYGYYTVLRLLICGFSLFLLFSEARVRVDWERWVTGGWAVLYNPILPVHIGDKGIWIVLNVLTVAWFWFIAARQSREPTA